MSVDQLERNGRRIRNAYTVLPDKSVVAKETLDIYFPKKFLENGMAVVTDKVWTACVVGLVMPGECYAPLVALVDQVFTPLTIRESVVKGVPYMVMGFDKGDIILPTITSIQDPNKPASYFKEFNVYARWAWYTNEQDLTSLYDNAQNECGSKVGSTPQVSRVLNSIQMRDPDNPTVAYRYSKAMLEGRPPLIVGLNNKSMLVEGVFPKMTSGYLQDNTIAAIVNPDTRVTDLEEIIKGVPK